MGDIVRAFGLETAARLTGLSRAQLIEWDRSDLYRPSLAQPDRRMRHSRVYDFKDVLALKVLGALKSEFKISTQHLRKAKRWLGLLTDNEWADQTLYVDLVRRRIATPDEVGDVSDVESGQKLFSFALGPVRESLIRELNTASGRAKNSSGEITRRKGHVNNKEVFAGTRIPVSSVISFVDEGYTDDEILEQYPSLTKKDLQTARELNNPAA